MTINKLKVLSYFHSFLKAVDIWVDKSALQFLHCHHSWGQMLFPRLQGNIYVMNRWADWKQPVVMSIVM